MTTYEQVEPNEQELLEGSRLLEEAVSQRSAFRQRAFGVVVGCALMCVAALAWAMAPRHPTATSTSLRAGVTLDQAAPAPPTPPASCQLAGGNCLGSKCCKTPGFQCFEKDEYYATCRPSCTPGVDAKDIALGKKAAPWSCKKLGEPAKIPDGIGKCSWSGENCIATRCCNDANMKCFLKDDGFAGCKFNNEKGWNGTIIGDFRGWHQIVDPAADGEPILGSSLYCVIVQSPANKRVDEVGLVTQMQQNGLGIFQCDAHSVLIGAAASRGASWKSVANTDIFINIWNQVIKEGTFWKYDWTVKVDPDAVFFANRLKWHLEKLRVPKYEPVYIKNCNFKFGFMGSLEIFSNKAMEMFHNDGWQCQSKIGHTGGEDFYMMTCMDALGVGTMADPTILHDKYTLQDKLILDDVSHCNNGWTTSFHPYRTPQIWMHCHNVAAAVHP